MVEACQQIFISGFVKKGIYIPVYVFRLLSYEAAGVAAERLAILLMTVLIQLGHIILMVIRLLLS